MIEILASLNTEMLKFPYAVYLSYYCSGLCVPLHLVMIKIRLPPGVTAYTFRR